MPGLHAKKSPSGSKIWHECRGYFAMVDSLPPEMRSTSGYASKLGTISHFLLESSLRAIMHPSAYADKLIQIQNEGTDEEDCAFVKKMPRNAADRANTFEVDDEVIANVAMAYEYVERRCEELGVSMSKIKLETRTNPVPDRNDTSGTADVTIDAWPGVLELLDFKNGRVVVEHKQNPQVLSYLAGKAHDEGWDYMEYRATIVQPNGRHEEGKVRSTPVSKEELLAFVEKHRKAAEACDEASTTFPGWRTEPNREDTNLAVLDDRKDDFGDTWADENLVAGEHCGNCDASGVCPAYKAFRKEQAREEDWDTDEDGEVKVPDLSTFRFTALQDAVEVIARAGYYRTIIRKAQGFLLGEAKAGRLPPGMKWVRKVSKRRWNPDIVQGLIPDLMVKAGLIGDNSKAKLFAPSVLITGPQAEKLITGGKGAGERKAKFNEEFIIKPKGGLKLVLASAPGEPEAFSIEDEFEDEEGDDYGDE